MCLDIHDFFWELGRPFRAVYRFFANTWFYRRELWTDHPYDHCHLLSMLKRKLEQMVKSEGVSTTWEAEKKNMRIAIRLIERINKEDYVPYEKIFENDDPLVDLFATRRCRGGPYLMPFPRIPLWEHEASMLKQDYQLLMKILERHLQCWWD